jgi:hypothetical protein
MTPPIPAAMAIATGVRAVVLSLFHSLITHHITRAESAFGLPR